MKKFVLAFGIPVLAVASLIGSGYATWYFNNTVADVNGKIGVNIEPEKVVGAKFKPLENNTEGNINNLKLVLDQTDKTGEKDDGMPHDRLGVHFDGSFSESLIADDGNEKTTDDKFVGGTHYKVTTKITIPSKVAKYVNFTFDGQTSSPDSTGDSTLKKELTYNVTDDTQFENVFNISEVTVTYANEPSTLAAYKTMVSDVTGQTISISFAAEIVVA